MSLYRDPRARESAARLWAVYCEAWAASPIEGRCVLANRVAAQRYASDHRWEVLTIDLLPKRLKTCGLALGKAGTKVMHGRAGLRWLLGLPQ